MFVSGNSKLKRIDAFKGIIDAADQFHAPDESVKFSVGGYYGVHADYTRINGKKLVSTSMVNGGSILSIHQLDFTDRTALIHHSSSSYMVSVASELISFRVLNTSSTVLGPIIPPP